MESRLGMSKPEMSPYFEAAMDIAELVQSKQLAYGDAHGQAGKVMEILFPNGIPIDRLEDALTITRIVDKLFRIANQKDAFGENPYADITGYGLLGMVRSKMKAEAQG